MTELIVSPDLRDRGDIVRLVDVLGARVSLYKVGSVPFSAAGPELVRILRDRGKDVFLDLKAFDIPNTVGETVKNCVSLGVAMMTIHLLGGERMVRAACRAAREDGGVTRIVGVTALTSLAAGDLENVGIREKPGVLARRLAERGHEWGVDGIVCSGEEVAALKREFPDLAYVCPGVRPAGGDPGDQERVVTPAAAAAAGADYIVVGRPVYESRDPGATVDRIREELRNAETGVDGG